MTISLDRILTCSLEAFLSMQDEHFDKSKYMPVGVSFERSYQGTIIQNLADCVPNEALVVVDYRQSVTEYHKSAQGTALVPKDYKKERGCVKMAISLDRILNCSLEAFLAMQDEHFEKEKYMPIGVHVPTCSVQDFAKYVPDEAIVVVNYQASMFNNHTLLSQGTALVPKGYKRKEVA